MPLVQPYGLKCMAETYFSQRTLRNTTREKKSSQVYLDLELYEVSAKPATSGV